MSNAIPFIMNGNGTISVMIEGTMRPIDTAHKNYEAIKDALKNKDWESIPNLVNIAKEVEDAISKSTTANGKVVISDGEVFYNGTVIQNTLTSRIISMAKEGFDIGHMTAFLENLMLNPSYRAVNELYDFLEVGSIPITENGTFLAYKKIRNDWTDIYTGKIDNSIGAVCSMPRNMVNEDSSQTCSAGLHVCSYDYLSHWGSTPGDRVVICEVNPANVVSIPADYNNTKMRVCEYKVIGEVTNYREHDTLSSTSVVYTDDVTSGRVSGTVSHSKPISDFDKEVGKEVGKYVSGYLKDGNITTSHLFYALVTNGVDRMTASEIQDIAEDDEFIRVGKKVAKLIANGFLDPVGFIQNLREVIYGADEYTDEYTDEYKDYICHECGMNFDTEDEDEECFESYEVCERCGTDLKDGEYECPICGFYN